MQYRYNFILGYLAFVLASVGMQGGAHDFTYNQLKNLFEALKSDNFDTAYQEILKLKHLGLNPNSKILVSIKGTDKIKLFKDIVDDKDKKNELLPKSLGMKNTLYTTYAYMFGTGSSSGWGSGSGTGLPSGSGMGPGYIDYQNDGVYVTNPGELNKWVSYEDWTGSNNPPPKTIWFYGKTSPYYEFTNFYPLENFKLRDGFGNIQQWSTSEHYFQAHKFWPHDKTLFEAVRQQPTPRGAFTYARNNSSYQNLDWDKYKDGVMSYVLQAKFTYDQRLKTLLLSTQGYELVEHTNNDGYWGDKNGTKSGNHLGQELERLRAKLLQNPTLSLESPPPFTKYQSSPQSPSTAGPQPKPNPQPPQKTATKIGEPCNKEDCPSNEIWFNWDTYAYHEFAPQEEGYPVNFTFNGKTETWPTVQRYWDAHFYSDQKIIEGIRKAASSADVSNIQKKNKVVVTKKPSPKILYPFVRQMFQQHQNLKNLLLGTGNKELVSEHYDETLGLIPEFGGDNEYGKLLMQLRTEFRNGLEGLNTDLSILAAAAQGKK